MSFFFQVLLCILFWQKVAMTLKSGMRACVCAECVFLPVASVVIQCDRFNLGWPWLYLPVKSLKLWFNECTLFIIWNVSPALPSSLSYCTELLQGPPPLVCVAGEYHALFCCDGQVATWARMWTRLRWPSWTSRWPRWWTPGFYSKWVRLSFSASFSASSSSSSVCWG